MPDLETAMERNAKRSRSLPDEMINLMWKGVQKNIGKFQNLFRNRFIVVDNSTGSNVERAIMNAYKTVASWAKSPPENSIAQRWMKDQNKK